MKLTKFALTGLVSGILCGVLSFKSPMQSSFFIMLGPGIIFGLALVSLFWENFRYKSLFAFFGSAIGWVAAGFIAVISYSFPSYLSLLFSSLTGIIFVILGVRSMGLKLKNTCWLIIAASCAIAIVQPTTIYNDLVLQYHQPNYLLLFPIWQAVVLGLIGYWLSDSKQTSNTNVINPDSNKTNNAFSFIAFIASLIMLGIAVLGEPSRMLLKVLLPVFFVFSLYVFVKEKHSIVNIILSILAILLCVLTWLF